MTRSISSVPDALGSIIVEILMFEASVAQQRQKKGDWE
jgi:hypothetical protein